MTASNDHVDGVDRRGGDDWAAAEKRAGHKAQWVVLGLGVGIWAATVALGAAGELAVPLILGFAAAGGLSVSGAV
jgi:hypothetical protein